MDRLPTLGYRAPIQRAMAGIPHSMHDLLRCDFLCATDPIFAGLHAYDDVADGRSYRTTAHVSYAHNQAQRPRALRTTTVVLPERPDPWTPWVVIHELGHVLHERLGWRHAPTEAVTTYATQDRYEAFAEAFTAWCQPFYAKQPDAETMDYLDRVAAGELR